MMASNMNIAIGLRKYGWVKIRRKFFSNLDGPSWISLAGEMTFLKQIPTQMNQTSCAASKLYKNQATFRLSMTLSTYRSSMV